MQPITRIRMSEETGQGGQSDVPGGGRADCQDRLTSFSSERSWGEVENPSALDVSSSGSIQPGVLKKS